jgi:hypothetical protein
MKNQEQPKIQRDYFTTLLMLQELDIQEMAEAGRNLMPQPKTDKKKIMYISTPR